MYVIATATGTATATGATLASATNTGQTVSSTIRVFVRMKINSSEDLTDPTVMENFLQKV